VVDFVSEVQEELRKDDYNKWLKKYGPLVVAIIVAVILFASYLEWKKSRDESVAAKTSYAYLQAAEASEGDPTKGVEEFLALSGTAPTGYAGLSLLRASSIELDKGNLQQAVNLLDQAAGTFESPRHGQLAQMKAAYILAGQGSYSDVITRMGPLAEKGQPYEYLARELIGFSAKESGDLQTARKQFSYLETIPGVPDTVQRRAKQNLLMMNLLDGGTPDATPEPAPSPETSPEPVKEEMPAEGETNE